jgi:hypothetical protein
VENPISEDFILTKDHESKVLELWESGTKDLIKIIHEIFGEDFDGRSKPGRAVRSFLASQDKKYKATNVYIKKNFELTDEQKQFIKNNLDKLTGLEMTRTLLNDKTLTPLSAEHRAVFTYVDSLDEEHKISEYYKEGKTIETEYRGPRSTQQALVRINKYATRPINPEKLTSKEKQNIQAVLSYLNVHRYLLIMNEFVEQRDRDLMESSYVRFIYDKGNITEEEIEMYLNWCLDIVNYQKMQRDLNKMIAARDDMLTEGKTISKSLVDQINKLYEETDSTQKRMKQSQEALSGKRKDRIEAMGNQDANILQLVEAFKENEKRQRIIQLAEARKKDLASEFDRLQTMDSLKAEIFGLTREEMLNGL